MDRQVYHPLYRCIAIAAMALTLTVVILGAFTRLTDAGLGCPDWPGCYGRIIMPSAEQAANRYPHIPLDPGKALSEMVHRYAASTVGLTIIGLLLIAWRQHQRLPTGTWVLPAMLLLLVIFQGLLGMWTVTLQLHPLVVMAHLLGGMTILGLLTWVTLSANWAPPPLAVSVKRIRVLAKFALAVLIMQIALGGWTSANYAALSCPDFPTCQGQWLPPLAIRDAFTLLHPLGQNFEGGILDNTPRVTIHLAHRIGALITVLILGTLCLQLLRRPGLRGLGGVLGGLLIVQVLLGINNVVALLPLANAVAHNGVAALLLIMLLAVNYRLRANEISKG